jgi:hypothetical protein
MDKYISKITLFFVKNLRALAPAFKNSMFAIIMAMMVVGGHVPMRTAHADENIVDLVGSAGDGVSSSTTLGEKSQADKEAEELNERVNAAASAVVANEDEFRLLNFELPINPQRNIDYRETMFEFHSLPKANTAGRVDESTSMVEDHLSANLSPQVVNFDGEKEVAKIVFRDPRRKSPYLTFYADKNESIKQAFYHEGVLFLITESKIEYGDTEIPHTKLNMIDLVRYQQILGQARPPVFQVSQDDNARMSFDGETIKVGETNYDARLLQMLRDAQEVTFNIGANLLDPETYEAARTTIGDLELYTKQATDLVAQQLGKDVNADNATLGKMKDYLNQRALELEPRITELQGKIDDARAIGRSKMPELEMSDAEALISQLAHKNVKQKTISSRINMLTKFLQKPRYAGSRFYMKALETLEQQNRLSPRALERFQEAYTQGRIKRLTANTAFSKAAWAGTLVTLAVFDPDQARAILLMTQEFSSEAGRWFSGIANVTIETAKGMGGVFFNFGEAIYDRLLAPGERHKLAWATSAMFGSFIILAASSHFGVIAFKINKEYRRYLRDQKRNNGEALSYKEFLIQRQREKEAEYLDMLKKANEAEDADIGLTKEDKILEADMNPQELEEHRSKLAEIDRRAKETIKELRNRDRGFVAKVVKRLIKDKTTTEIISFKDALKHAYLSMPAVADSRRSSIPAYLNFFYARSFVIFPRMNFLSLRYPNAVSVIMSRDDKSVLPTDANGGRRTRAEQRQLRKDGWDLEELKLWEDKIIDVELAIEKVALRKSIKRLTEFMYSAEDLNNFYSGNGITSAGDAQIQELPPAAKNFFMSHYEVISTEMMIEFLRDVAQRYDVSHGMTDTEYKNASLAELKQATIKALDKLKLSPNDAEKYFIRINERLDLDTMIEKKITEKDPWLERFRWNATKLLDPKQNKQSQRIHTTRRLAKLPANFVRAVRATFIEMIVDKPLEIVQTTVLLAGVTTGIGALFGPDLWGKESIFYLGRFAFLYGFVWYTFFGLLAAASMKLQLDEANTGDYKNVPKGKDAERGYWSWYLKHVVPSKFSPNKYLKLHKHIIFNLIIPNIPAFLTLSIPVQLIFLGRVELDTLLMGYLLCFFAGTNTHDAYLDQAYEFSAAYHVKDIPEDLRSHPESIKYINEKQLILRFKTSIISKTVQNVVGIFNSTLMTIASTGGVTKSFIRSFFGGYTPVELVLNPLATLRQSAEHIPVVKHIAAAPHAACHWLLGRTYTDGAKLIIKAAGN